MARVIGQPDPDEVLPEMEDEDDVPRDPSKLTDWKNEPTVLKLRDDLTAAKDTHDTQVSKVQTWNDARLVQGKFKPKKIEGRSSIQPRLIQKNAEWRYPSLSEPFLSAKRLFDVQPRSWQDEAAARQNQLILNYQFDTQINKVKLIDSYTRCAVDDGGVVLMVAWRRITRQVSTTTPVWQHLLPYEPGHQEQFEAANMARQQDPGSMGQMAPEMRAALNHYDETGQVTVARPAMDAMGMPQQATVMTEELLANHPLVSIVKWDNFYYDPSCGDDFEQARFAIRSFETSRAELELESDRYRNLDRVTWEMATPLGTNDHSPNAKDPNYNITDKARRRVVAFEYWGQWDVEGDGKNLKSIVATWVGETLIRCEESPYPDGKLPFVVVPLLPDKHQITGHPDAEFLIDNQDIQGALLRGMIDLLGRSANSQQGFAKGMLDVLNRKKFDQGKDYEYNPTQNPNQALIQHVFPEIPSSAMSMFEMQNTEAEALTGVKAFSQGISGDAYGSIASLGKTAMDAMAKREMSILRRLADGIVQVGRRIVSMNAYFLSEQEVVRITDDPYVPLQESNFQTIQRSGLAGDFDLKVDISTPEVDQAKATDIAFMLQTMGPKLQEMDPTVLTWLLADFFKLKRMPELEHKMRAYQPPPPSPEQQQLAQLEIQLKQVELAVKQAEVKLKEAQAQKALMEADQADLDRSEQENGVTHARRMQELQAQSDGNQDAEIGKALLKPRKEGESKPQVEAAVGWGEVSRRKRGQIPVQPPTPVLPKQAPAPSPMDPGMMAPSGMDPTQVGMPSQ